MSRLIVKNLPNNVTGDRLRKHFEAKGQVTDVQLKYTKDGVFRHFGFVGFKTEGEAQAAKDYFDGTFVGACKISVECSAGTADPNKPRAWSKYAVDSSAYQKRNQAKKGVGKESEKEEGREEKKGKKEKRRNLEEEQLYEKYKDDPQFTEFLEVHFKSNKNVLGSKPVLKDPESKEDEGDEKEPSEEVAAEEGLKEAMKKSVSDSEYLKSKKPVQTAAEPDEAEPQKKKKKKEKEKKWKVLYTVKLRDLPLRIKKKDLKDLFKPLKPKSIRRPGSVKGIAYVGFGSEEEQSKALKKNKSFVRGKQVQVLLYTAKKTEEAGVLEGRSEEDEETRRKNMEIVADTGRLFIRNLTYSVTEDDLTKLFKRFGPLAEVNVPIDRYTRLCKGFAFVTFVMPEHAVRAYSELDGNIYQGRLLHLVPGQPKKDLQELMEDENLSFKEKKKLKQKIQAKSSTNWNSLFLGSNAVADVIAERYNTSKQEVLNPEGKQSVAVRLALGETQLVAESKSFLESQGVRLEAFGSAQQRSKTVLLAKDLPAGTQAEDLHDLFGQHGLVERVVLPPHGITALVEFQNPSEARTAYTKLAYTKFYHLPLYLEWAPIDVFDQSKKPPKKDNSGDMEDTGLETKEDVSDSKAEKAEEEEEVDAEPDTTLFVKNLNFSTTEQSLREHFESCGKLRVAKVATKKNLKHPGHFLSMGYAFVQFQRRQDALNALKTLQQSELDGHELELKVSNRDSQSKDTVNARKKSEAGKQTGSKILVRNVPFQAKKKEIEELFRTFGELKAVRLPLKLVGSGEHRGFAFVDFHSKEEAKRALQALGQSTHLYGRRLVLEWAAAEDDEVLDRLRTKAAHQAQSGPPPKKKKVQDMFSDILGKP